MTLGTQVAFLNPTVYLSAAVWMSSSRNLACVICLKTRHSDFLRSGGGGGGGRLLSQVVGVQQSRLHSGASKPSQGGKK